MALPPQQFCVRWNSYHTNLQVRLASRRVSPDRTEVRNLARSIAAHFRQQTRDASVAEGEPRLARLPIPFEIVTLH